MGLRGPKRRADSIRGKREIRRIKVLAEGLTCTRCGKTYDAPVRGRYRLYCPACTLPVYAAKTTRFSHATRARKEGAKTEPYDALEIFERDGWKCGICGEPVDRTLKSPDPASVSLDHITPLCEGGDDLRYNVQCSHWGCNNNKAARQRRSLRVEVPELRADKHRLEWLLSNSKMTREDLDWLIAYGTERATKKAGFAPMDGRGAQEDCGAGSESQKQGGCYRPIRIGTSDTPCVVDEARI